jgi:predicted hydrocarbon binding protein
MPAAGPPPRAPSATLPAEVMSVSRGARQWIRKVVEGLAENTDRETCARVLEACGRDCVPESLMRKARAIYEKSSDIGRSLSDLGDVFDAVQVEDDRIYVVYPKCFCPHIQGIPVEEIPNAYCDCSVGWVKQLFEAALGRPVEVRRVASVVAGDAECRFEVVLG